MAVSIERQILLALRDSVAAASAGFVADGDVKVDTVHTFTWDVDSLPCVCVGWTPGRPMEESRGLRTRDYYVFATALMLATVDMADPDGKRDAWARETLGKVRGQSLGDIANVFQVAFVSSEQLDVGRFYSAGLWVSPLSLRVGFRKTPTI